MEHLGDITQIDGYEVPIVDCLIGGSPCQDLSIAGLRKGLEGERSGLFMEQIRLVREMRANDRRRLCGRGSDIDVRPRYMVWENVPGAFSSNKGEDFRVVLEEVARIVNEDVTIPRPEKGKWMPSGAIIGDGFSIAWRVFDAQYWGVPQRRKRICLVADFNGYTAAEIVFNESKHNGCTEREYSKSLGGHFGEECGREVQSISESLSGNPQQSGEERQDIATYAEGSIGTSYPPFTYQDREGKPGGGKGFLIQEDKSASLRCNNYQTLFQPVMYRGDGDDGGDTTFPIVGDHDNRPTDMTNIVVSMDRETFNCGSEFSKTLGIREDGIQPTLVARGVGGVCYRPDLLDRHDIKETDT